MVFQVMAPRRPARRTFSSTISMWTMPLPMVLATAVQKTKAAMKFQNAAQTTARKGVSTRVETTVAMELAASCQPFENSKVRVRKMTTSRREKLDTGGGLGRRGGKGSRGSKGSRGGRGGDGRAFPLAGLTVLRYSGG